MAWDLPVSRLYAAYIVTAVSPVATLQCGLCPMGGLVRDSVQVCSVKCEYRSYVPWPYPHSCRHTHQVNACLVVTLCHQVARKR
ncbi:hypothetical protein B0H67DRAFT_577836 [Lasiosphaeris hirsuta]|uniref:Uncharacterized protein n=1 Tax=Lasiosphaeris hirsuta TaxID=260670 RepID=A0AA40AS70_9PEZI|nr:hypothetical protein B0H67DRAFT_577836 [Lasiosphaeris hirsuta]